MSAPVIVATAESPAPALPSQAPPAVPAPSPAPLPAAQPAPVVIAAAAPAADPIKVWITITEEQSSILAVADARFQSMGDSAKEFLQLVDFFLECDAKVAHDSLRIDWVVRMIKMFLQQKYQSSDKVPAKFAALVPELAELIAWAEAKIPPASPEKKAASCCPW